MSELADALDDYIDARIAAAFVAATIDLVRLSRERGSSTGPPDYVFAPKWLRAFLSDDDRGRLESEGIVLGAVE